MKKIFVVGTTHDIQYGEKNKCAFYSYIKELCIAEGINVIAEEINDDAAYVVAKNICNDLSISHKIIDPNPGEYGSLGIKEYHKIVYEIMQEYGLKEPPSVKASTPDMILKKLSERIRLEHHHPRELEWLRRIEENNCWPTLVICGSAHFDSICDLFLEKGIKVVPKESNWMA